MEPKENILFSWNHPKKLKPSTSDVIKRGLRSKLVFLAVAIIVIFALYAYAKLALPENSGANLEKALSISLAFAAGIAFIFCFILPLMNSTVQISKYQISDKGIRLNSSLHLWKRIVGFYHKPHDEYPDITVLFIFMKFPFAKCNLTKIYIGEDDPADNIIETLSQRLPLLQDPDIALKETRLSIQQHAAMWCLVVVYALVLVSLSFFFMDSLGKDNGHFILPAWMLCILLCGPGRLCHLLFFRKNKLTTPIHKRYAEEHAALYNLATLIALLPSIVIVGITKIAGLLPS